MAKWTTPHKALLAALIGLALAAPVAAQAQAEAYQEPAFPLPTQDMLLQALPDGASIEVRIDRDINGDGIPDTACVGGTEDDRRLLVLIGYKEEVDWGS